VLTGDTRADRKPADIAAGDGITISFVDFFWRCIRSLSFVRAQMAMPGLVQLSVPCSTDCARLARDHDFATRPWTHTMAWRRRRNSNPRRACRGPRPVQHDNVPPTGPRNGAHSAPDRNGSKKSKIYRALHSDSDIIIVPNNKNHTTPRNIKRTPQNSGGRSRHPSWSSF